MTPRVSLSTLLMTALATLGLLIGIGYVEKHDAVAFAGCIVVVAIVAVNWIADLRGRP